MGGVKEMGKESPWGRVFPSFFFGYTCSLWQPTGQTEKLNNSISFLCAAHESQTAQKLACIK